MNWRIPLFDLDYGKEEEEALLRVLRSKWISQGPETLSFEREFAQYLGIPFALATSSGTSALHLAYISLGVKPNDEIIVPSFTFVATVSPLLWIGAIPVFVDIESPEVPNISARKAEALITERTKGVVFVHYAGFMRGIEEIRDLCEDRGLFLLEDASHAHGASWKGKKAGTFGEVAVFSMFANKNLPIGEGGVLVTKLRDIYETAKKLRSHGMTRLAWDKFTTGEVSYDVEAIGFNYRITELGAALARVQLKKLERNNDRRRKLVRKYRGFLSEIEGVKLPFPESDVSEAAHYICPVLLESEKVRSRVIGHMKKRGIQTSIHYPPIHRFSIFKNGSCNYKRGDLINTEIASRRELTLPLWPGMKEDRVIEVVNSLKEAVERR